METKLRRGGGGEERGKKIGKPNGIKKIEKRQVVAVKVEREKGRKLGKIVIIKRGVEGGYELEGILETFDSD